MDQETRDAQYQERLEHKTGHRAKDGQIKVGYRSLKDAQLILDLMREHVEHPDALNIYACRYWPCGEFHIGNDKFWKEDHESAA